MYKVDCIANYIQQIKHQQELINNTAKNLTEVREILVSFIKKHYQQENINGND